MLALLDREGVVVERLDMNTAAGLADAAWYELAGEKVVPVLSLREDGDETKRFSGALPTVKELKEFLGRPHAQLDIP